MPELGAVIFVCRNKSMKVKLGDVCERGTSNLRQSDVVGKGGDYPIYGASGYIGDVDFYHQEKSYVAIVKDGAGIGRTMLCPEKSSVIGTMQYLLPKDAILPQYLYYVVKYMHLEKYFSGATIPHIYFKDYKNEQFNLDTLKKQAIIVKILGKCEEVIAARNKQLNALDELIQARFVELFGEPILNPKEWKIVTIGDIALDVRYGTSRPAVEGGKYPYLRMNNLTIDGHLDLTDLKYIDIPEEELEKCVVRKGDILFNRTNSLELVGKTAVFDLCEDMVIAGYIIRVRLNNKMMLPEIFSQYMNHKTLKKILRGMAKGAVNQANINAKELQSIKIYVPNMKLQDEFVTFVNQVNKSKVEIQQALEKTQLLFDSLMQQYFG